MEYLVMILTLAMVILAVGTFICFRAIKDKRQRNALVAAFGYLILAGLLFYIDVVGYEQSWATPLYVVCFVLVPIALYYIVFTLGGKGDAPKSEQKPVSAEQERKQVKSAPVALGIAKKKSLFTTPYGANEVDHAHERKTVLSGAQEEPAKRRSPVDRPMPHKASVPADEKQQAEPVMRPKPEPVVLGDVRPMHGGEERASEKAPIVSRKRLSIPDAAELSVARAKAHAKAEALQAASAQTQGAKSEKAFKPQRAAEPAASKAPAETTVPMQVFKDGAWTPIAREEAYTTCDESAGAHDVGPVGGAIPKASAYEEEVIVSLPDTGETAVGAQEQTPPVPAGRGREKRREEQGKERAPLTFEGCMAKAVAFKNKGHEAVAAKLFAQSALLASDSRACEQALFDEIACYIRAGEKSTALDRCNVLSERAGLDTGKVAKLKAMTTMLSRDLKKND